MISKKTKADDSDNGRECFHNELESLLQASCNTTGIPEPSLLNQFEDAGKYAVYLSTIIKHNDDK